MKHTQAPAELIAQTNATFAACNTVDGFRVPEGQRLEMWSPGATVWYPVAVADGGSWIAGADYRLAGESRCVPPEIELAGRFVACCISSGILHLFESPDDFVAFTRSRSTGIAMSWIDGVRVHADDTPPERS